MKEEGGCPFTKMCKLAGTPHVGAILIVLFVIAGAVFYLLPDILSWPYSHVKFAKVVKQLNALSEKEQIENGLKKFRQAPSGYIKIMNVPDGDGSPGSEAKGKEGEYPFVAPVEFTGTPEDPEFRVVGPKSKQVPANTDPVGLK